MILGVTGPFGCGKSAVLEGFRQRGWQTADADALCHGFYAEPGGRLSRLLVQRWGCEILDEDGSVNRRAVAGIVFCSEEEMAFLTGQLYPLLMDAIDAVVARCRTEEKNAAIEIPLLYEEQSEEKFDRVLAVWAEPEIRYRRLKQCRNFTDAEIRQREKKQLPADEKLERADYALINNGGTTQLELQLDQLMKNL